MNIGITSSSDGDGLRDLLADLFFLRKTFNVDLDMNKNHLKLPVVMKCMFDKFREKLTGIAVLSDLDFEFPSLVEAASATFSTSLSFSLELTTVSEGSFNFDVAGFVAVGLLLVPDGLVDTAFVLGCTAGTSSLAFSNKLEIVSFEVPCFK